MPAVTSVRTPRVVRRLVLPAALVALGGLLTGCFGGSTSPDKPKGNLTALSDAATTLTMWAPAADAEVDWATAAAADFHALHPNITIKVERSAQVTDIKLTTAATVAHKLPDLMFSADAFAAPLGKAGTYLDLTPYQKAYGYQDSDFLGKVLDLGRSKGSLYVVPRGVDQVVTMYNPELFQRFGVPTPTKDWTFDDFVQACQKLTQQVDGKKYYGLGGGYGFQYAPVYLPFMRGWGGDIVNSANQPSLNDPKVVEGVSNLIDVTRKYSQQFAPPPKDPFAAGLAGMTWLTRPLVFQFYVDQKHTKWTLPFTPAFATFPLLPTPQIGAGMAGYAVSKQTAHPNEAAAFAMYLLSERGALNFAKVAGEVPIRKDLSTNLEWQDAMNIGGKRLDQSAFTDNNQYQSYQGSLPISTDPDMSQALNDAWDAIRLNRKSVKQALEEANGTIAKIWANADH